MSIDSVYRLRPINDRTIEEITQGYLWFSKPMGFKDKQDSNIQAFFDNCDILKNALDDYMSNERIEDLYFQMKHIGICCFTSELPINTQRYFFPNGINTICVEYNKAMLEEYFLHRYALADCFKRVEYFKNPTIFEKDGEYHIITQDDENGIHSEPVKGIFFNERVLDKFFWKLLTRIDRKFINQKELRIVLAGRNITNTNEEITGYKIIISQDVIKAVYVYPNTEKTFVERLKQSDEVSSKLVYL